MPAAFFEALGDARTRWLDGDADAWSHYVDRCLQLEAELQSTKRACSSTCSGCRTSSRESGGSHRGDSDSRESRHADSARP